MEIKSRSFIYLILFILLTSCKESDKAQVIFTPTDSLHNNINFECPAIETDVSNLAISETLVVNGIDGSYLMNMSSSSLIQYKPNEFPTLLSVSPSQTWIAYHSGRLDKNMTYLFENLVVVGRDSQTQTIPWENGWGYMRWLDNAHLIINVSHPPGFENYRSYFLLINPFTKERQILNTDYPDIYDSYPLPDWDGWGITAYNSTLTRVVYLKGGVSGPFYYTLWDIQHKNKIVDFQVVGNLNAVVRWSLDGERFAFAQSLFSKIKKHPSYEMYIATKEGIVTQVTHLTNKYPWVYIADLSWSPNNQYIAFWYSYLDDTDLQPYITDARDRYLGVVNVNSGETTVYCIHGELNQEIGMRVYRPPLWSPDSRQVIIQSQIGEDYLGYQTILVDIQDNRAYLIADKLEPVGWLK